MFCFVSDNSSFAEVQKQVEGGFRLFNQFTVFAYSQLQSILPDSTLGNISNWDGFLHLDLDSAALPYKSPDEFILNEDFHRLVIASKLPRPGKFVEQSISFCKAFCRQLLNHDFVQSDLLRGLSAFLISHLAQSKRCVLVVGEEFELFESVSNPKVLVRNKSNHQKKLLLQLYWGESFSN